MPIIQQLLMDRQCYEAVKENSAFDQETLVHVIDLPLEVYETLRGHSDIFACSLGTELVAEPRTYDCLLLNGASGILKGESAVGTRYPATAFYNALVTDTLTIHNAKLSDPALMRAAAGRQIIQVKQGYSRCTTVEIASGAFMTSDLGIFEALKQGKQQVHFIPGDTIQLTGQAHGFIGGCCGLDRRGRLWFYGSLKYHPFEKAVKSLLKGKGVELIELLDAPLKDIGGLLFWDR